MSKSDGFALYVRRDEISRVEVRAVAAAELAPGQARLSIEGLAFSANTVSYALTGDALGYWQFFPAPQPHGLVPTWGIARVVQSRCDRLAEGGRWFGLLPLASELIVTPNARGEAQFIDATPNRATLPANYNLYRRLDADAFFSSGRDEECALLRPLALLSFLIVEDLKARGVGVADQVMLTSASSKAALMAAHLARAENVGRWLGLTSARHTDFVRGTGVYEAVHTYEDIDTLDANPQVFLDFSGDSQTRARVEARWGASLRSDYVIGATHWGAAKAGFASPSAKLFFAPSIMQASIAALGASAFETRLLEAWRSILDWTPRWLTLDRRFGAAGLKSAYLDLLRGAMPPDKGIFVVVSEAER